MRLKILLIVTLVFSGLTSCSKTSIEESEPAYWPNHDWESSLPEKQGLDSAHSARMFEYDEDKIP